MQKIMANYKKKEHYCISCNKQLIEVSEPIYRAWRKGRNKEDKFKREYHSHTICIGEKVFSKPGRIMSLYDKAIAHSLGSLRYEPYECVERKQQHELLFNILQQLPERYKSAIYYIYFREYTESHASAILGISQSAFHGRKDRALAWLRDYCQTHGITAEDFDMLF